jgi:hypothetical protein
MCIASGPSFYLGLSRFYSGVLLVPWLPSQLSGFTLEACARIDEVGLYQHRCSASYMSSAGFARFITWESCGLRYKTVLTCKANGGKPRAFRQLIVV